MDCPTPEEAVAATCGTCLGWVEQCPVFRRELQRFRSLAYEQDRIFQLSVGALNKPLTTKRRASRSSSRSQHTAA